GAWDGFYSFECERRGADEVVATDSFAWSAENWSSKAGFELAREALGSSVRAIEVDVMDLSPGVVGGTYDLVLFLGVLYHLRYPRPRPATQSRGRCAGPRRRRGAGSAEARTRRAPGPRAGASCTRGGRGSTDRQQVLADRREHVRPVGGHHHEVLDPHAEAPGDVHARLDGDDGAGLERRLVALGQARLLVDLQPDAVAEAVAELVAVAGLVDDRPRHRVDLPPGAPGAHGVQARLLGALDEPVDLGGL